MSEMVSEVMTVLLKSVGISIIGSLASRFCRDAGENALAYSVELATRICILAAALPLLVQTLQLLKELSV